MKLLILNTGLFLALVIVASWLARRTPRHARMYVGAIIAIITLPAILYSLYYLHLFNDWPWFYQLRSYPLANFYPASLGCLAGWLLPSLPSLALQLATITAIGLFVVVPFTKPVLLPLDSQQLSNRWLGSVCLQSTPATCGPASVATILASSFGDVVSESEIARSAHSTSTGTEIWYLAQFLRARGYQVAYRRSASPIPYSVAGTQLGSAGHFVAILGCTSGKCEVADPLSGIMANDKHVRFNGFYMQIQRNASSATAR